jgi:SAM-dependent methyltransferase
MDANAEQRLSELLEVEKANTCGEDSRKNYFVMHQARFADILQLSKTYVPDPFARVLDVGRSELTAYLSKFYKDVHTLGLDPNLDDGGHREVSSMDAVPHIVFDLLNSNDVAAWPASGRFDLIIFSEVIEHLSLAPEYVFAALNALLKDKGGVLICTTPNAADIAKRVRAVLGRNPYERLRLYSMNPGHIREYTGQELREIAESVGLQCVHHAYFNWIQPDGNPTKTLLKKLARSYPSFRSFQACIFMTNK